ncbi:MAG: bifunctional 2-polyprenyl-6-hydroxyphenol methylase/3-demethylubiquinol 3-O-methyltransferase UbiG [Betaproteobacteria bacterium]|nr:bifunctional 2-polyprenyl-6-hydroxyphenol methylase/3-demethylubiquinol 3-O-methyltransferase UbiG [Betaproteobacteria bacterium]
MDISNAQPERPKNADSREVDKFSALAHRWWDPKSEFAPLHAINPLRLRWIDERTALGGKRIVDVGCGGGILTEGMASLGARVKGIDLSDKALRVARLHLLESRLEVDYECVSVEAFSAREPGSYDVVTCMELLEHVPDPASTIMGCVGLVRPGGHVFFSTINRNIKSYALAVIGAEYILKLLPRGTHDYARFLRPSELARHSRSAGLAVVEIAGMTYNPLTQTYALGNDTDVNYLVHTVRETSDAH